VPWYVALTAGAVLFASLVMAIVGIDYLRRVHGIRGKIAVRQVRTRSISLNPATNKLELRISIYIINNATRPIWIRYERAQCSVDLQTHEPTSELIPIEVQPGNYRGVSTPTVSLDSSKSEFEGWVEVEAKYGKNEKANLPYRTKGAITINVANTPVGWTANVMTMGGTASWD
jgi:hypothetical protein